MVKGREDIVSRQIEQTLHEAKIKYLALVDHTSDGVVIIQDEVVKYVNKMIIEITGYSTKELLGKHFKELVLVENADLIAERYKSRIQGKGVSSFQEYTIRCKDGTTRDIEATYALIQYEGRPAIIGTLHDITEKKKAAEQIYLANERLNFLLSSTSAVIYTASASGDFGATFISNNVTRMTGYEPKQFTEESNFWIDHVHTEDVQRILTELTSLFEKDEHAYEYRFQCSNGEYKWVCDEMKVVRDKNGQPLEIVGFWFDISGRKVAEEELQRQEEYFRSLIDNSLDAIAVLNADGTLKYASPSYGRVFGHEPKLQIGKSGYAHVHEEDIHRASDAFGQLFQNPGSTLHEEVRVRHKDGSLRTVEVVGQNLLDNPAVEGIVANFRDVTIRKRAEDELNKYRLHLEELVNERTAKFEAANDELKLKISEARQAEKSLRESEKKFRDLAELLPLLVFEIDERGRFTFANQRGFKTFGYKPEDINEDFHAFQTLVAEDRDRARKNMKRVLSGERFSGNEYTALRKDGSTFPILIFTSPIMQESKPVGLRGVVVDISERKQIENELRKSEQNYKTLFDSTLDCAVVIDAETMKVLLANQVTVEKYGFGSIEEISEVNPLDYVHPDDRERAVNVLAQGLFENDLRLVEEFRTQTKDGQVRWVSGVGTKIEYVGRSAGLITFRDITDRKLAEAELQKLYEKEKELREELQEEMRRRVEFTRALAHELKTPLTSVLASSDLLASEVIDEPLSSLAGNIVHGATNLNNRIDELLDLARGEVGMLQLKMEPIDMSKLLREAVSSMTPLASKRGQTISAVLPHSLPQVQADKGRLQQVVTNLLNNALKFTPVRGDIKLAAKQKNGAIVIQVRNTGSGISKEDHKYLFEPYHRLQKEPSGGLGLGLALCKTLVELHGGQIWVRSQKGKGSTFSFSIPLGITDKPVKAQKKRAKLWRLLIIEDDENIVSSVSSAVQMHWSEAELISATTGKEGLQLVKRKKPDLVILDLGLPDVDGFDILKKIRLFSSIPVVIFTVRGDESDKAKGVELGSDDYIVKPFRPQELLAILKAQVRKTST